MRYTKLFTGDDGKSYFAEIHAQFDEDQPLGRYSKEYYVKEMKFREFEKGAVFDWHTAPHPQYIIYLEGEVEVETSGGEKRIFKPGDVLFAADVTGNGHITRTLSDGRSIIVTAKD